MIKEEEIPKVIYYVYGECEIIAPKYKFEEKDIVEHKLFEGLQKKQKIEKGDSTGWKHAAKLDENLLEDFYKKFLKGWSKRELCDRFNIHGQTHRNILTGKTWAKYDSVAKRKALVKYQETKRRYNTYQEW